MCEFKVLYLIVLGLLQYFSNIILTIFFKWKNRRKYAYVIYDYKTKHRKAQEKSCSLSHSGFLLHPDCLLERWFIINNPSGRLDLILSTCQVLLDYINSQKGKKFDLNSSSDVITKVRMSILCIHIQRITESFRLKKILNIIKLADS